MTKASEVLAGPPSPVGSPGSPPALSEQERKRRRKKIWCEHCQRFHRLPKPASEESPTAKQ